MDSKLKSEIMSYKIEKISRQTIYSARDRLHVSRILNIHEPRLLDIHFVGNHARVAYSKKNDCSSSKSIVISFIKGGKQIGVHETQYIEPLFETLDTTSDKKQFVQICRATKSVIFRTSIIFARRRHCGLVITSEIDHISFFEELTP